MQSVLTPDFVSEAALPTDAEAQRELVAAWHHRKTAIYTALIASAAMPVRPGIARLTSSALSAGFDVAVASTSAEASVRAVLAHAVGNDLATAFHVFAGDQVAAKKPAPDIYRLALLEMGHSADDVVVVEGSAVGLRASYSAGLRTVVTISSYTVEEEFSGASLVLSSLGEPAGAGGPRAEVLDRAAGVPELASDYLDVGDLLAVLATPLPPYRARS